MQGSDVGYRYRVGSIPSRNDAAAIHRPIWWSATSPTCWDWPCSFQSIALAYQLRWLISGDRRGFTATAGVDLADVFDHADLHRHDFQLLACFFADGMLAAAASTSQLVLGQFVEDFDAG